MPVPTYDRFIEPIVRYFPAHPDGAIAKDVHDAVATALGLTDADRAELLPSGIKQMFKNRAGWAQDYPYDVTTPGRPRLLAEVRQHDQSPPISTTIRQRPFDRVK